MANEQNLTPFSSTYQPPNESKRVPKWKHHLRKELAKRYPEITDAIIQAAEKGSIKHIEFIRDWLYGKVENKVDFTGKITIEEQLKELSDEELEGLLDE